jgi:hypothetical protein
MKSVLIALMLTVVAVGVSGCVGKGKAPPPPVITKG